MGLQLLENSAATGAALVALILIFGAVSGAHFNPAVTLVDSRPRHDQHHSDAGVHIVAQIVGGCAGAVIANLMFDLPAIDLSTQGPLVRRAVAVGGGRHGQACCS